MLLSYFPYLTFIPVIAVIAMVAALAAVFFYSQSVGGRNGHGGRSRLVARVS